MTDNQVKKIISMKKSWVWESKNNHLITPYDYSGNLGLIFIPLDDQSVFIIEQQDYIHLYVNYDWMAEIDHCVKSLYEPYQEMLNFYYEYRWDESFSRLEYSHTEKTSQGNMAVLLNKYDKPVYIPLKYYRNAKNRKTKIYQSWNTTLPVYFVEDIMGCEPYFICNPVKI